MPTGVHGQVRIGGESGGDQDQPVLLKADLVRLYRELEIITATGNVEFSQGGRILLADTVTYNQRTETITATGNISLMEPSGEVYFADFVELSDDLKDGVVEGIRVLLPDQSRIAAVGGRLVGGIRSTMRKAVYSPCEICKEHPDRPPTWQIKAFEVVHDRAQQEIEYKDAWLEFYGVPVLYVPYFYHPDSTVKRKSGFLVPSFGGSSELGTMIRVPYHIAISPTTDATITPIFTSKEGPVLFAEYRNRFVSGLFEGRGSITHGTGIDAESKATKGEDDEEIRGHFKGRLGVDIDDTWRAGAKLDFASDDTYLRRYGFGDAGALAVLLEFGEGRAEGVGADGLFDADFFSRQPAALGAAVFKLPGDGSVEPAQWIDVLHRVVGSKGQARAGLLHRSDGGAIRVSKPPKAKA